MKKPDRYERMARRCIDDRFDECPDGCQIHAKYIAELPRREHAWMVRMVKSERLAMQALVEKISKAGVAQDWLIVECLKARIVQCEDILLLLGKRKE